MTEIDRSTEDEIIFMTERIMTATSWLPSETFDNDGESLDGYPIFVENEPYEIIWSYKDNT